MDLRAVALIVVSAAVLAACRPDHSVAPREGAAATVADSRPVVAAAAAAPAPAGDIEFRFVVDLDQTPSPRDPELRGGREAVSAEWPASLYATFAAHGATAACTAALVGPSVLLTAAHCAPAGGTVTFTFDGDANPYVATCTRHPAFTQDPSADFALCAVTPAFAAPAGFLFETVDTSEMTGLLNRTVILSTFGCVSTIAVSAPFDGKYRIGFTTIDGTSQSPAHTHDDEFYAPREQNNLFTSTDPAKANLCPGDTAGPVFVRTAPGDDLRARAIAGVTSRVFRDAAGTGYGASLISATGGPSFREWAGQWARQAGVAACGIAGSLTTCRN